jgi:hypothetical protein
MASSDSSLSTGEGQPNSKPPVDPDCDELLPDEMEAISGGSWQQAAIMLEQEEGIALITPESM